MADFAAAGATDRAHFASRERREVVVQHERLRRLACFVDRVEALHVVGRAERHRDQRLCLTASKERRAMRAGQKPDIARDRANIGEATAIHAMLRVEHLCAKGVVLLVPDEVCDIATVFGEFRDQGIDDFFLDDLDRFDPRVLVGLIQCVDNATRGELLDAGLQQI
jgi:hypothetical protein